MKVSVITLSHNRINLLKRAVYSFIEQDYKNSELIVLDNGCTDGSTEFLKEIADKHPNIKILRNEQNTILGALNKLWLECSGELICQVHDDDMLTKDGITLRVEKFKQDKFLEVCYGGWVNKTIDGKVLGTYKGQGSNPTRLIQNEYINFTTMMWKNDLKKKFMFDEDLRYYVDWLFKIRCVMECAMTCIEDIVMNYTIHNAQESMTCRLTNQNVPEEKIMRQKLKQIYGGLFL
jgi:glycosyltransferase involved in cell wall biosynthesis